MPILLSMNSSNIKFLPGVVLVVGSIALAGIISKLYPDQPDDLWPYPPAAFFIGLAVLFWSGDCLMAPAAFLGIGIMFAVIGYFLSIV